MHARWIGTLLAAASVMSVPAVLARGGQDGPVRKAHIWEARAHWLAPDLVAWRTAAARVEIVVGDGMSHAAEPAGMVDGALAAANPHLAGMPLWRIADARPAAVRGWLRQPVTAIARNVDGGIVDRTGLQLGAVVDRLFATDAPLGVRFAGGRPSLALWAPTARSVRLHLFDAPRGGVSEVLPMRENAATGVWQIDGDPAWKGRYYLYEVEVFVPATGRVERNLVTDPYSLALASDSARSLVVDLTDPSTKPAGWDRLARDLPAAPEDRSFYELHVRDFSIGDASVPAAERGRYLGFTHSQSAGMRRLRGLAAAGLSDVHLLPTFDCATIPERRGDQAAPGDLTRFPAVSERQQTAIGAIAARDGFNWCYDPWHYQAPEGSYATDPDGIARIREFRSMVAGLAGAGLGTVLDVVFNHTMAAGQDRQSVLDRIVPGYYHRLDEKGAVATSTCCANTATERRMMERLLIDSLVVWARDYKVSGFRFDLMGHHSRETILRAKAALARLTLAKDGVDGRDLYLYGEGWNFGEVANDARFVQATQVHMGEGTGVGTFNDRLRDALRGGGPSEHGDDLIRRQGLASGLYTAPNALSPADPAARVAALKAADQVRAGLAGGIAAYRLSTADGREVATREMDYNGSPLGYASDPQETVNYAEAHDNQTLFDSNAYKLPRDTTPADRVRWQNLATSVILLSQGIPFIHAGQERLRSKSLDRNSFNSGDWFNRLDPAGRDNGWGRGLPPRADNERDWPIARTLLADQGLRMGPAQIARAEAHLRELLAIRRSSPLFRLRTGKAVAEQVHFEPAGEARKPGLIVVSLGRADRPDIVVVVNATREAHRVATPAGKRFALHPVQARSDDAVLRGARVEGAAFVVPALTTTVWTR